MSDYGDDEALTASNGPSASAMLGPITQWLRSLVWSVPPQRDG